MELTTKRMELLGVHAGALGEVGLGLGLGSVSFIWSGAAPDAEPSHINTGIQKFGRTVPR